MPSIDPRDSNWDKELEKNGSFSLPDCRLKPLEREAARIRIGRLILDQVFCSSCAKPFGGVPPDCPHVFYLCDECVQTKGAPPDCIQVPGT